MTYMNRLFPLVPFENTKQKGLKNSLRLICVSMRIVVTRGSVFLGDVACRSRGSSYLKFWLNEVRGGY